MWTLDFRFYLITDRKLITDRCSLIAAVKDALKGGVKAIQLREKDLDTRELLKLAYKMRELTAKHDARLFINDRFDVALAVGADGVHLTQNSIPADAVRKTVRRKLLMGVSTHSLKEAKEAEKAGADFITSGPVYRTPSKLKYGRPLGIDALRNICSKVNIPVFAIGGIKSRRINEVRQAGAYGVAMISEIFGAEDISKKSGEIINKL
ncbi:MAG: thiamine phosphate synthase [Nitrospiraceae bacterium]|nr:MAG: thiamine phosphate synthase [Nitrospiraceae bacterium]